MTTWILPLVFFILLFLATIAVIIVSVLTSKSAKKPDLIPNSPLIEIDKSRKRFTNGYTKGTVRRQISNKNGTTTIEFYPSDSVQRWDKPLPNLQVVVVKTEFLKRLARGDDSDYREVIKTIARFRTDIPEKLRDTQEGKELAKEGQLAYLNSTFGKYIEAGDEAIEQAIINTSRIGLSKMKLAQIEEEANTIKKVLAPQSKEEKEHK